VQQEKHERKGNDKQGRLMMLERTEVLGYLCDVSAGKI